MRLADNIVPKICFESLFSDLIKAPSLITYEYPKYGLIVCLIGISKSRCTLNTPYWFVIKGTATVDGTWFD